MYIITHRRIVEFATVHPNAASTLDSWYRAIKSGAFQNIAELKAVFPSADLIRKDVFVFNIGGNAARLVASVDFARQRVYILAILMHAEYDKDKWKGGHSKMAQPQFDPHSAVADAVNVWGRIAPVVIVPTSEADFHRLLAVIDEVLQITRGDVDHPLADLLYVLGTLAHEYEQAHDPDA